MKRILRLFRNLDQLAPSAGGGERAVDLKLGGMLPPAADGKITVVVALTRAEAGKFVAPAVEGVTATIDPVTNQVTLSGTALYVRQAIDDLLFKFSPGFTKPFDVKVGVETSDGKQYANSLEMVYHASHRAYMELQSSSAVNFASLDSSRASFETIEANPAELDFRQTFVETASAKDDSLLPAEDIANSVAAEFLLTGVRAASVPNASTGRGAEDGGQTPPPTGSPSVPPAPETPVTPNPTSPPSPPASEPTTPAPPVTPPPVPAPSPANQAPTGLTLSNASVEEQAANHTVVGLLTGSDPDAGDALTFSLVDDAGGRFAIDGNQLIVADGTLLDYDAAASHVVRVRVSDGGNLSYERDFTIGLDDVNLNAPSIPAVAAQTIVEDGNVTFSSANGNALTVADIDTPSLTLTLTANHGKFDLGDISSVTVVSGGSSGASSVVLTGTATALNAALEGLVFYGDADYAGAAGLDLSANDGTYVTTRNIAVAIDPVADTASVTNAATSENTQTVSGLVLSRNSADGTEVTHFKITGITGGTLYLNDGTTVVTNGTFLTYADAHAGLKFTPTTGSNADGGFDAEASTSASNAGLGGGTVHATITVGATADTPVVTGTTTFEDTQSTTGLVISRNAADGNEVTHFKITNITGGTLYLNDGSTAVSNGDFLTYADAHAGLKFTPDADSSVSGGFDVQSSTSNVDSGLGGSVAHATVNVTPVADTANVTDTTTLEDTQSTTGLVISRNAADGAEVTHFKITGIVGGTLYLNDGTTAVSNGSFLTYADAHAGLKFTPDADSTVSGGFDVQSSTSNSNAGLGGSVSHATVGVTAVADTASVTDTSVLHGTQSTAGLVVSRASVDGAEVTHFQITGITGGTLYLNDGTTVVTNGTFLAYADAHAGLKFTPSGFGNGGFDVQSSTSNTVAGLGGSVAHATVNVSGYQAPVLGGFSSSATFNENQLNFVPQLLQPSGVAITDADSTDFGGGSFRVAITSGTADETLTIRNTGTGAGQIGISGSNVTYGGVSNVTYGGVAIGTFSGGSAGGDLVVSLNGSATAAAMNALAQSILYQNASDTPAASRDITFSLTDGNGQTGTQTTAVNVTAEADPGTYTLTLSNTDLVYGSRTADLVITPSSSCLTGSDTIYGGSGSDTLRLDGATTINATNLANAHGIDVLAFMVNGNYVTITDAVIQQTDNGTLRIENGANTLGLTTSHTTGSVVLAGTGSTTLAGGSNLQIADGTNGTVVITSGAATTLTGGTGNDTLTASSGLKSIDMGEGNDLITINSMSSRDTLIGGLGVDTLATDALGTGIAANKSGFEVVSVTGGGGTFVLDNAFVGSATGSIVTLANGANAIGSLNTSGVTGGNKVYIGGTGAVSLAGGAANIVFIADGVNGSVIGGSGNDAIYGGNGADYLNGGGGTNILYGGAGADTIVGGTGTNFLRYDNANDFAADSINGSAGYDVIQFLSGGTVVSGDYANKTGIDGFSLAGSGSYSLSLGTLGTIQVTDSGADGTTIDASNMTGTLYFTKTGTGGATVTGSAQFDSLIGAGGNDSFISGAGNDVLSGGAGNDTLNGGANADTLTGGTGSDLLTGGTGLDFFRYAAGDSTTTAFDRITDLTLSENDRINLGSLGFTGIQAGAASGMTLGVTDDGVDTTILDAAGTFKLVLTGVYTTSQLTDAILFDDLVFTSGNDSLIGNSGANVFTAPNNGSFASTDTVSGGAGSDTIAFQSSHLLTAATFANTTGIDALKFYANQSSIALTDAVVAQSDSGNRLDLVNGAYTISSLNTSGVTGSNKVYIGGSGAVTLAAANNTLYVADGVNGSIIGGTGADSIVGGTGNDFISGGGGTNTLAGGAGADTLTGGANTNYYDFASAADFALDSVNGSAGYDVLRIAGGGSTVAASALANKTSVEAVQFAGGTAFTVDLGTYTALSVSNSVSVGGSTFDASNLTGALTFYSYTNAAQTVTGSTNNDSITAVTGTSNDSFFGGAGNDVLSGIGGNDTLSGGIGNDTLTGGTGADSLTGGTGLDRFAIATGDSTATAFDRITDLTLAENDRITLGGMGFTGIQSGAASGTVLGVTDDGTDTTILDAAGTFKLVLTGVYTASQLSDAILFDNLLLTAGSDSLAGNADANIFSGFVSSSFGSSDTIAGGTGSDAIALYINQAVGAASFTNTTGIDALKLFANFSSGLTLTNAVVAQSDSGNRFDIQNGIYTISSLDTSGVTGTNKIYIGGSGAVTLAAVNNNLYIADGVNGSIIGGTGADTIVGGTGNDYINGGAGNNSLAGGAGGDTLIGAAGEDTLYGGAGADSLAGGGGNNYYDYDTTTDFGADTIDGGGYDIVRLKGGGTVAASDFANKTSIDQIDLSPGQNFSLSLGTYGKLLLTDLAAASTIDGTSMTGTLKYVRNASSGTASVTGSAYADTLTGGGGNDTFSGGAGRDSLTGGAGADLLTGGTGGDLFKFATGYSTGTSFDRITDFNLSETDRIVLGGMGFTGIQSGAASGTVLGYTNNGTDTTIVSADGTFKLVLTGVYADLSKGIVFSDQYLSNSSTDSVAGTASAETIYVFASGDLVSTDTVAAGTGSDTLLFEADQVINASTFTNVSGIDAIAIGVNSTSGITLTNAVVTQSDSGNRIDLMNGTYTISSLNTNGVTGSNGVYIGGTGAVTLAGGVSNKVYAASGVAASVLGGTGDDSFIGNSGNSTFSGGAGNDNFTSGSGAESLIGGSGNNFFYFSNANDFGADAIDASLGYDAVQFNGGGTITASDFANKTGIDQITLTGTGPYNINLGTTNGFFVQDFTNGATTIDGSNRTGSLDYSKATGYGGIAVATGSNFADTLTGGTSSDTITGGAGVDLISGRGGADLLTGGTGGDLFRYSTGESTATATDRITDFNLSENDRISVGGMGFTGIQSGTASGTILGYTNNGTDTTIVDASGTFKLVLTGVYNDLSAAFLFNVFTSSSDSLAGSSGADQFSVVISGHYGSTDTVAGGAGSDAVNLFVSQTINAATFTNTTGIDKLALYANNTSGITITDAIVGQTDATNRFDVLNGGFTISSLNTSGVTGGNKVYIGGIGAVTLAGAANSLYVEDGINGSIVGGSGADSVTGGTGNDYIDGGTGNNVLSGGAGNDTLLGGTGIDSLFGGTGEDLINGGAGNDSLSGGDGNDTFSIGSGQWSNSETIDGGIGTDILNSVAGITGATLANKSNIEQIVLNLTNSITVGSGYTADGGMLFLNATGASSTSYTQTIDGSAATIALSIAGGAGNDTLYGGTRADSIYGGTGADNIRLGASDGYADSARYISRGEGASAGAATGYDTITQFETANDKILFGGVLNTAGDANDLDDVTNDNHFTFVTNAAANFNSVYEAMLITGQTDSAIINLTTVASLANGYGVTAASGENAIIAVQGATQTAFYYYGESSGANSVGMSELNLLGVVNGQLNTSHFDFF